MTRPVFARAFCYPFCADAHAALKADPILRQLMAVRDGRFQVDDDEWAVQWTCQCNASFSVPDDEQPKGE